MTEPLDVIIIGAGSAGLAALREVRKRTDRFVLINDGPYGTTCARVGCMPSKTLIEAANAFHRRHALAEFGIRGGDGLNADLPAVLRRVRKLRDEFVAGTLKATEELGERNIAGRARLTGRGRIAVNGRELSANRIIIATGSRPVVPSAWSAFGDRILTTDSLFEQETLGPRAAVIGMGAIGVEVAQALSRLGLVVTGFDVSDRVAGLTDETIYGVLRELLSQEFAIHTGAPAELRDVPGGIEVRNGDHAVTVDQVIVAMGRRPNLDGLGLEALGISSDAEGMLPVDAQTMQLGDLPLFIAGDASGAAALLHEAADEGHIAGLNALADWPSTFRRRIPLAIVFSDPGVAMVGRRRAGLDEPAVVCGTVDFSHQGRASAAQRNRGRMHIYADRRNGRLLGSEMCAPSAEHMAHLLALAIERALTVHDLLRIPFYHPVLEEGMRTALRELARQLPPCGGFDLADCDAFQAEALD